MAYVYEVLVHPEHRHQGNATRAFLRLEEEVRQRGMTGTALHFFGHNAGAKNPYEQLGYRTTNVNMFKAVGLPGADGSAANEASRSQS